MHHLVYGLCTDCLFEAVKNMNKKKVMEKRKTNAKEKFRLSLWRILVPRQKRKLLETLFFEGATFDGQSYFTVT